MIQELYIREYKNLIIIVLPFFFRSFEKIKIFFEWNIDSYSYRQNYIFSYKNIFIDDRYILKNILSYLCCLIEKYLFTIGKRIKKIQKKKKM